LFKSEGLHFWFLLKQTLDIVSELTEIINMELTESLKREIIILHAVFTKKFKN